MQHVGSGLGKEAGYLAPGADSVVARVASRRAPGGSWIAWLGEARAVEGRDERHESAPGG